MPNIDAELADTRDCESFAELDFCSGYCQALLHPDSRPYFAFTSFNGVVLPTSTTQRGFNSVANFQKMVKNALLS